LGLIYLRGKVCRRAAIAQAKTSENQSEPIGALIDATIAKEHVI